MKLSACVAKHKVDTYTGASSGNLKNCKVIDKYLKKPERNLEELFQEMLTPDRTFLEARMPGRYDRSAAAMQTLAVENTLECKAPRAQIEAITE